MVNFDNYFGGMRDTRGRNSPRVEPGVCKGARYANLWDSLDQKRLKENNMFWVLFEGALVLAIHSRPKLSRAAYEKYRAIAYFQVTVQHMQIRVRHEIAWYNILYMVTEAEIY